MYWRLRKVKESESEANNEANNEDFAPIPPLDNPTQLDENTSWQDICFVHSIPGKDKDNGIVVLADGSMRSYISCKGINALLFDEQDRESLARSFAQFVAAIESDVQIIVKSRNLPIDDFLSRYDQLVKTENDYLKWYADYANKWFRRVQEVHFVPQREFYVVVSYRPPDLEVDATAWIDNRSEEQNKEYAQSLTELTRTAIQKLASAGLRPHQLSRKEVRNLIYFDLNPTLAQTDAEAPASVNTVPEAASLAGSALKVMDEHLWLDGTYQCTQYLQATPDQPHLGWLVGLLTLSADHTLSIFIHKVDKTEAWTGLKKNFRSGIITGACKHDYLEQAERVVDEPRNPDHDYEIGLYIRSSAQSAERLAQVVADVRRAFRTSGAVLNRAQLLQLEAWQSTLAVGVDRLAIVHRVARSVVGTYWPFFTAACGTPDGVPFGFSIASREPVLLNPFFRGAGKDANNMLVVGSTGAGLSFAVSMLILRLLPLGTRFVLVDKTVDRFGTHRFITRILGPDLSSYVDLGPSSNFVLNPFDLGLDDISGQPSAAKRANLLSLLDLMLAPEGSEELTMAEKAVLENLIRLVYAEAKLTDSTPTMSDLVRVTQQAAASEIDPLQRQRLNDFALGLSLFTRDRAFGGFIDGLTNIDPDKLYIVFDTGEVTDPRLEKIALFLTTQFISNRAGDYKQRGIRFAAVIDEAATVMRSKAGAKLLDDLSRRSRHFGMMLVTIARDLDDFFRQSDYAKSIVKNCHMKLILRQDPGDLKLLKETFRLTDAEVVSVEQFSKDDEKRKDGQCLLIVGAVHGTIRLVPSPMDYWICTSEPTTDIPKRFDMISEVKGKNPKLNETDACRQAVYYLGVQHEA